MPGPSGRAGKHASWEEDWWGSDEATWAGDAEWNNNRAARGGSGGALKRALEHYPLPNSKAVKRRATVEEPWESTPRWSGSSSRHESINERDRADIEQWRGCTSIGESVAGLPIVPCKTPFEGPLAERAYAEGLIEDSDWFGKEDLLRISTEQGTPVGLVVDLVNTEKYYTGFSEQEDGVEYQKFWIPGRTVPERTVIEEIFDLVDDFVTRRPGEYVAVHCTHGVNRTGFLVAAYLMTRAHLPECKKAVKAFERARGTKMDKLYLIEALQRLEAGEY